MYNKYYDYIQKGGIRVETKKLTESAMLSALFIVMSIMALGTGVAYSIYLDLAVPIIVALIYLKCDFKYSLFSVIISIIIVVMVIGDISSALFMFQGMIIGMLCGGIIKGKYTIYDDIIICSVCSCIVMVFIDINFSTILGVSFIREFKGYVTEIPIKDSLKEILYYLSIVSLPLGTVFVTYLGTIFLGKKLNLLNDAGKKKILIISKFQTYGSYLCCSEKTLYIGISYLLCMFLLKVFKITIQFEYINLILELIKYIMLYFVIEDSYSFIGKYVYRKCKSKWIVWLLQLITIFVLFKSFTITFIVLVCLNLIISRKFKVRENQIDLQIKYKNSKCYLYKDVPDFDSITKQL